ncbi:Arc family DNA-binding protein [Oscillibacter sp.]|uniref:Arc family DNA-binding protein n=1 Tax=Oscillibacter sp. TaxID=1945593 RepID=UPI0028997224|nr:Arc family DNA-binding protein [Oscillibacter sp.]
MAGKSEYRNTWIAEKLDRVNLTVPKGQKDAIKAHATAQGESVNAFINRAITEAMERDGAAGGPQTGKE